MPVITGGLLGRGRRRPPAYGGIGVPPVLSLRSSRHKVGVVHCRLVLPLGPVSDFIRLSRPFRSFARGLPSAMNEIGPIPEGAALALGVLGLGAFVLGLCWVGGVVVG